MSGTGSDDCGHTTMRTDSPEWDADDRVSIVEVTCSDCGQVTTAKVETPSPGRHFFTMLGRKAAVERATEGDLRVTIFEENPEGMPKWRPVGKARVRSNFETQKEDSHEAARRG